ncbi:leucine--tRNA ligase [Candidatus Phytoplasma meliae]|uniref:Leucine--tRNA ligase n=1 Tax=Candidatus Phytoplasma meliae TaxID=1848402 RepID=A0ABS5CXV2_9MOLU|nr:leucine--tRNA ligase [Candidatus Phytoplasma meliae]MBP5835809.1 leucine--tRNA ligase [Candidatus Phytoplasma meliae]MBP5836180.1 leucine--tRNA ligase [Candidatus Phytoplasma meliae]
MTKLNYDFKKIEHKWQLYWQQNKVFKTQNDYNKKKFYCLDMFPYPSSEGLHIGHIEGYTATDIMSRFKRMQQYNVFHPFGWDSFGLPAEQYALNTGKNPRTFTYDNISNFKKQIQSMGKAVDWDKELATSDSYFYKWTQWIFKKLYENKLAVLENIEVNFCPKLGTVLANEEVISNEQGLFSERGNHPIIKKKMQQWVLKITNYAERLLNDLELVDWPDNLKEMQINWIGKTSGVLVSFTSSQQNICLKAFTTRPDTLFGVTFLVISPEHPLVPQLTTKQQQQQVNDYLTYVKQKKDLERSVNKEKTGVFTGSYTINPCNNQKIPIWIADYVLPHFGTGILMAVPCHDQRDFEFAQKYNLKMIPVIQAPATYYLSSEENNSNNQMIKAFEGDGIHINSVFLNGLDNKQAQTKMIQFLQKHHLGDLHHTYKLHDWVFSRQRYWGEPFPIFYDSANNIHTIDDSLLPLELPILDKITPSGTGESPLSKAYFWLYFEKNGQKYRRDSNTMPQLAGSSWYYIGYILKNYLGMIPLNTVKAKKLLDYFLPVDLYVGGAEHAVGHLLYARFWHKFLYDLGLVSLKEPFQKLVNQGIILGHDHTKMSKSKGNGVSASGMLDKCGADVLRLYVMFMGPLEEIKSWHEKGLKGIQRFLNRVYHMFSFEITNQNQASLEPFLHQTIKQVTQDYEKLKFNKVISQLMIFVNQVYQRHQIGKKQIQIFLQLLNPIAPHITEEMNQVLLKNDQQLVNMEWPSYDLRYLQTKECKVVIQVNGKIRTVLEISCNTPLEQIKALALKEPKVHQFIYQKNIVKMIYISNKVLNIIVA